MKTAILASLVATAAAFAPAKQASQSTSLSAFNNEIGAQMPLGFFDPLGLVQDVDQAEFDRLREVEIRHGRVSMLAVAGWLTTAAGYRLPGMEGTSFGFKALTELTNLSPEVKGVLPLTLGTVYLLTVAMNDHTGTGETPADYRNDFIDFGWDNQTDAWKAKKQGIELNNGRAAQMG